MNNENLSINNLSEVEQLSHRERQTRIRRAIAGLLIASGTVVTGGLALNHILGQEEKPVPQQVDNHHYLMEVGDQPSTPSTYVPDCWPDPSDFKAK